MYQVFRSLSLLFMGLTSATFFFTIVIQVIGIVVHGEPFSMKFFLTDPIIFSLSGFALSIFLFDSFENLEKIKIKVKALDEIYRGKILYKEYLIKEKEGEK
jgi:hypothetical protein